ncbi:xanthine dehydrogenase subunit XdhB [Agrilactobacillus composti DSM 18527 = JCM 14202]|uniref:Xanthine dehydrogenase subunit XdhB n=1 Tax=Agrilactobacillus composti DSM 18527 = JCM 14202 TaxID=1423734 RepID=X0PLZ6_9LACO|nr:xanthine dehydrogenase subunit XdhB [Agrilactobacillus composti]KRM33167.1 xanthine dehydrogenase subunit XdhB [Agrilactobacillus composti DSM 18527 = JCM 14202]GAF38462.1 xanthine dehydrogenase, FAD binding subunit [Agrilactobacillus composti DSM 18527 = JCM 14202]
MYDITGYHEADSLATIFKIIKADPKAKVIAGGTDVLVKARERKQDFIATQLIGITRIPEMQGITMAEDGTLSIGALSTFKQVEKDPLVQQYIPMLGEAVSLVGGPQTRHVGTIGGNICNGATSADSAPTLFTYNATLEIHSEAGVKNVPIADFYKGAGWVDLEPGEILVRIKIAKADYEGYLGHYTKFAQRQALDIANLSCATLIKMAPDQTIADLRICFGVAAPTPIRMPQAEAFAKGQAINDATLKTIGKYCLADTNTRNSWRASKEYRDHLVQIIPARNILAALKEVQ